MDQLMPQCRSRQISRIIKVFTFLLFGMAALLVQPEYPMAQQNTGTTGSEITAELPDPLTPEAIRELVSRLSDQEVRDLLLQQLDKSIQAENSEAADSESGLELAGRVISGIFGNFSVASERIPFMITALGQAGTTLADGRGFSGFIGFITLLAACVLVGFATEWLVSKAVRQWKDTEKMPENTGLAASVRYLTGRAAMDALGVIVFGIASYMATTFLFSRELDQSVAWLFIISFFIIVKAFGALSRFTLAPNKPSLRLVSVDDHYSRKMHHYMYIIAGIIGLLQFVPSAAATVGIPPGEMRLGFWVNLTLYIVVIYAVFDCRQGIVQAVVGSDNLMGETGMKVARWWPYVAALCLFLNWMLIGHLAAAGRFDLLQGQQHIMLLVIIMSPALDTGLRGIVKHMTPPLIGEGAVAERAHAKTLQSYVRIGRVVLFVAIILLIAAIWDFDLLDIANQSVGAQFAKSLIGAIVMLVAGYVAWEVVNLWVNRRLAKEMTEAGIDLNSDEPGGGEGGGTGLSRLATVLPVIHLVANGIILIITPLLALGQLGINITPLLAGAGIIGLAVGFGAQTLVRDVVSGIFFLIEDAFRVGEYLVIGDTVGTVEKISLRSLQLRHHEGPIHTIPYGEIPQVTNNSRDWVIMKLKFTFPFDTDANKIKKIFKKIGAEMLEADYADDLIQTFKSQGVYDVDDVGVVIRGKFMTKPGAQWIIRKDIYNRVQKALDEAGIEFARKEIRVAIPGLDETPKLNEEQKKVIGAAAADAAEKQGVKKPEPSTP